MEGGFRSCDVGRGEGTQREIPGSWREVFEGRETSDLKPWGARSFRVCGPEDVTVN